MLTERRIILVIILFIAVLSSHISLRNTFYAL